MARKDLIARVLVAALALAAIAWLGLSYRNTALLEEAFDIAATPDVPGERIEHALDLVERSEPLNPDRGEITRLRVALQVRAGRRDLALETAKRYARAEPESTDAWALLADLSRTEDPELAAMARERWAELDPVRGRPPSP
jgi:tetratricopeptide (TPR) repeat protein